MMLEGSVTSHLLSTLPTFSTKHCASLLSIAGRGVWYWFLGGSVLLFAGRNMVLTLGKGVSSSSQKDLLLKKFAVAVCYSIFLHCFTRQCYIWVYYIGYLKYAGYLFVDLLLETVFFKTVFQCKGGIPLITSKWLLVHCLQSCHLWDHCVLLFYGVSTAIPCFTYQVSQDLN